MIKAIGAIVAVFLVVFDGCALMLAGKADERERRAERDIRGKA